MAKTKRKVSPKTRARLKALRKKHGLGEFKTKSSTRSKPMARRRRSRVRTVARRTYRRARSSSLNMTNILVGSSIVAVGEPILDSVIAKYTGGSNTMLSNGAKTAIGYYLAKKTRSPISRSAGMALMVIGIRNIVRPLAGGFIGAPAVAQSGGFVPTMI